MMAWYRLCVITGVLWAEGCAWEQNYTCGWEGACHRAWWAGWVWRARRACSPREISQQQGRVIQGMYIRTHSCQHFTFSLVVYQVSHRHLYANFMINLNFFNFNIFLFVFLRWECKFSSCYLICQSWY